MTGLSRRPCGVRPPRALPPAPDGVVAVLPVKRLAAAKSRLELPAALRQDLALAFALDVVAAVLPVVDAVVVVTGDERVRRAVAGLPVRLVPEPSGGTLLAAVAAGLRHAQRIRAAGHTLVVPADLPALTPQDVAEVLRAAAPVAGHSGAFVPDASGEGTTLLLRPMGAVTPARYGPGSALLHERDGAARLVGAPVGARQDVDTLADLHAVRGLRIGAHTMPVLRQCEHLLPAAAQKPLLGV